MPLLTASWIALRLWMNGGELVFQATMLIVVILAWIPIGPYKILFHRNEKPLIWYGPMLIQDRERIVIACICVGISLKRRG